MSTESEKSARMAEPELEVVASTPPPPRLGAPAERPPASRLEAQLHVRVGELQAQLAEVTRCLADAENRASELLSLREQAKQLESQAAEVFALNERVTDLETQLAAATAAAAGSDDARRDLERRLASDADKGCPPA
jgi:DNA repair exonuclease SbcCD ATPase subunit